MLEKKVTRRAMLAMTGALTAVSLLPAGEAMAARLTASTTTLTTEEKNDLLFMREEEKLARDVYLTLHDIWGTPVFANIATSEQQHMDAILRLLNTYKLPDPTVGKLVGEFVNEELQALYNALIARGKQSALEALLVGGVIEETDIEDLNAAMATSRLSNIDKVYQNLLNGSYNHLRAFARNIQSLTGQPYVAQVVSQEIVDSILGS
ncbi:MAG: ferritin [Proteobacteria bacterium]|nr:ferritin [Pseudomonadota bacterium]